MLVIQPFWGRPSNRFLERHLEMLAERGALAAVAVLYPTVRRRWRGVPVVSLSDAASTAGRGRWLVRALLRRLGVVPPGLGRRPEDGLRRLLEERPVDGILCQYATTAAALWEPLREAHSALFVHLHGADTVESMCPAGHRERLLEISRRALILCNSQQTRRVVAGWGLSDQRMVVKPLGVEVPVRAPERPRRDQVTVLQLGRLVGAKGPGRTIRAFERACEQGLRGRLLLVGDGPLAAACDRLVADSRWRGRIVRKPAVAWEEGRRLRRAADIATQHNQEDPATGQVEAFGVAIAEAMAEGLPVVGTRSGGVVEIVVDGVTGILVEPGDEEGQAAALLRLASDPELRRAMGAEGWLRARGHFSVEREARQLLEILGVESSSAGRGWETDGMASVTGRSGGPQIEHPPLVSVLTPTYNRAELLPETIESVLDQGYPRLEYLVLDDGSTDDTPEVAARYAGRIRYLRHSNMGEARTVNRGFAEAQGELLAVVNSDDPVRPGFVAAMVAALEARPETLVAYPDWELIDRDSRVIERHRTPEHDFELMVAANWCYIGPGAIFRRRLVELIGGRDPQFRQVGDLDFWLRAGTHGPFIRVAQPLATWRSHAASLSVADVSEEKVSEYVRVMERFFERPGLAPELLRLRPQALAMAHHIAALKTMWHRRPLARRHLRRSLRLHPTLRSRHPSHPRSLKILLRTFLLPQAVDRALLTRWIKLRYGRQPSF